jgi:hypothetical protein
MEARDIYHVLKSIVEPIHAHDDQMVAIAKWIKAEFEYKPQKQANGANSESKALHIDSVSVSLHEDDYADYMLEQEPEIAEEESKQKNKELDECADFIRKKGITPNLDSIY